MPSSADVTAALRSAADAVVLAATGDGARIVLIDGRSGAGKSTLARAVASRLDAQLLALDSVYPGWDGLSAGVEAVRSGVLEPLSRGERGRWRRWDWERDVPAEEHTVDPHRPLVVEGAGLLTPETARLAGIRVWVQSPAPSRRRRALQRDGDAYRPHWDRWAAQERAHLRAHRPQKLASIVVAVP